MDNYFKLLRAHEEIERLNVEIPRLATYLQDENKYLQACEEQVRIFDDPLAHQISLHRRERSRFTKHHVHRLYELSTLRGFTGSIIPGESVNKAVGESASKPDIKAPTVEAASPMQIERTISGIPPLAQVPVTTEGDDNEDLDDDAADDEEEEELSRTMLDILRVSGD